jgi:hypothetical protein
MPGKSPELPAAAIEALTKGDKIGAIKILRQNSGLGLKEAKDAVDTYVASRPDLANQFQAAGNSNKLWTLLVLILFVAIFLLYKFLYR